MLTDTSEFRINGVKGPAERSEPEYLNWAPEDSPVAIHMSLGAVDGIAYDVLEALEASPRHDMEVGGLLLGRVTGGANTVWIERYQRIPCVHSFGPHFILSEPDTAALEEAATRIFETRDMSVVGLYRTHTRPGLQLEESDFDLMRRYFSDPSDLMLLVKPGKANNLFAQFYRFTPGGGAQPVGDRFPFRGSVVTPDTHLLIPDTARTIPARKPAEQTPDDAERTRPGANQAQQPGRRLVPDFPAPAAEPAPSVLGLTGAPASDHWRRPVESAPEHDARGAKRWLPLAGALALVGGIAWFLLTQGHIGGPASGASATESTRPLGLYVDAQGQNWHVLWNPNATALHDARSIQLFAREGDNQNRIDLSRRDLAAGTYEYHPASNDVTFRLEVADKGGRISAESFRLVKTDLGKEDEAAEKALASGNSGERTPAPPVAGTRAQSQPAVSSAKTIAAKPIYKAPPVVAAGIRPRIRGTVPIDVRVHIDDHGRVTAANTITKLHDGLEEYLGSRAIQAAKQWKFEPAKESGKPVDGTQTIHFVFTR